MLKDAQSCTLRPSLKVIDRREPDAWVTEIGDDGERCGYPSALNGVGFIEDIFDGDWRAVRGRFGRTVNEQLAVRQELLESAQR